MIIYKYLKKKYLDEFKVNGSILVNTLYNIRKVEQESIRDELEGQHRIRIRSNKGSIEFSGKEFGQLIPVLQLNKPQQQKATIVIENGAQFNMQITNAFIFCTSLRLDASLNKKFGYDAYYKINNPSDFAKILYERLNEVVTIKCYKLSKVKYVDKPIAVTNANKGRILNELENPYWHACFTKPRKFSEEQEFRMAFYPEFRTEIEPVILTCPELRRCCKF